MLNDYIVKATLDLQSLILSHSGDALRCVRVAWKPHTTLFSREEKRIFAVHANQQRVERVLIFNLWHVQMSGK